MAAQVERQPLVAEQAVQVDVLAGVVAGVDGRAPGLGFAAAVVFADVADVAAVAEAGAQCEGRAEAIVGADAQPRGLELETAGAAPRVVIAEAHRTGRPDRELRSEEHTSELQSLMRISYAVFCLKKKKTRR